MAIPFSVLVVDDRPTVVDLVSLLVDTDDRLTLLGTAADGVCAVQFAQEQCPSAIICDVSMPRMDGLEALPLLRRACPDAVVVMYSSDPHSASTALDLGADAVVDKVGDPSGLMELVVALCSRE